MKISVFILLFTVLASRAPSAGGDNTGNGGGGPAIVLRSIDDSTLRIITSGKWNIDELEDDLVILNKGNNLAWPKFELKAAGQKAREMTLPELEYNGFLNFEEYEDEIVIETINWQ
jgi:hypothetical protein